MLQHGLKELLLILGGMGLVGIIRPLYKSIYEIFYSKRQSDNTRNNILATDILNQINRIDDCRLYMMTAIQYNIRHGKCIRSIDNELIKWKWINEELNHYKINKIIIGDSLESLKLENLLTQEQYELLSTLNEMDFTDPSIILKMNMILNELERVSPEQIFYIKLKLTDTLVDSKVAEIISKIEYKYKNKRRKVDGD